LAGVWEVDARVRRDGRIRSVVVRIDELGLLKIDERTAVVVGSTESQSASREREVLAVLRNLDEPGTLL
jgi:hypothetical protein